MEDTNIINKNITQMSHMRLSSKAQLIIGELNSMHGKAKEKVIELVETLRNDGLKDKEIKQILFKEVHFISRPTLYRALPEDMKRDYTKPVKEPESAILHNPEPHQAEVTPIPTVFEPSKSIPIPLARPNEAYQVPAQQQEQTQKKQPDYKIIKSGIIPKAFQEIVQEMRQFNYRTDKCKMGLLIYYI